jgi:enoyl-CoA hydratase/carnithine racemase
VLYYDLQRAESTTILRLAGDDTNRLTRDRVLALTEIITQLAAEPTSMPLIITGNQHFFSAGADLNEITSLSGPQAYDFAAMGQRLMNTIANFPAATFAAVWGYCMGGGLDLALACRHRIAHPHAVFGHRGAALGLITGWGGTQRLSRLVGKARALEMFTAAEKLHAQRALEIGLIEAIADNPIAKSLDRIRNSRGNTPFPEES